MVAFSPPLLNMRKSSLCQISRPKWESTCTMLRLTVLSARISNLQRLSWPTKNNIKELMHVRQQVMFIDKQMSVRGKKGQTVWVMSSAARSACQKKQELTMLQKRISKLQNIRAPNMNNIRELMHIRSQVKMLDKQTQVKGAKTSSLQVEQASASSNDRNFEQRRTRSFSESGQILDKVLDDTYRAAAMSAGEKGATRIFS